jgi:1,4-alpha-glucan branching enzyme
VVAVEVPVHGYIASANVTVPPLGAVWLRLEPVLDEEQEEPEKVQAGVRAAARIVSPAQAAAEAEAGRAGDLRAARQSRPTGGEKPSAGAAGAEGARAAEPEEAEEEPPILPPNEAEAGSIQPTSGGSAAPATPGATAEVTDQT